MTRDEVIAKWNSMQPRERDAWVWDAIFHKQADGGKYSTDDSAAREVMEKFRNPVGMKVAFGFLLKEVAEAVQDRHSIHPMSLIWHLNPENICLAALIAVLTQERG